MLNWLKKHYHTDTAKQSLITSISTITNGVLGAAFYFLLARFLGASEYGLFSLAIFSITTLSGVFDFGSDQSLVMFIPKYKFPGYLPYVKLAFFTKLISGLIVSLLLVIFQKYISVFILRQPQLGPLMWLIGVGLLAQLLFSFSTSIAQSLQKYLLWGLLFVSTNLVRLLLLVALFYSHALTGITSVLIYSLLPISGFVALLWILKLNFLNSKITSDVIQNFFSFNKWVTGFTVLSAISSRLDVFYSARYVSISDVGIYSLVTQLVSILPQLTSSLGAVISPKFSSFTKDSQNSIYVKKTLAMITGVALISGILLIPISIFILNFSGHDYFKGFSAFIILLISSIIFLIFTSIRDSLLYYFAKPKIFVYTGILQIFIFAIASPYLMSKYSILGSSILVLLNILFSSLIYSFIYSKLSNEK